MATAVAQIQPALPKRPGWIPWLLGAGLLSAVIASAVHFAEDQAFVRLAQRAEPWWLAAAVALQAGTYAAQGGIWRRVSERSRYALTHWAAFELGLAKVFADQALPSAGLSSSILIAKALDQRKLAVPVVNASVLINLASYHLAYVAALLGAIAIIANREEPNVVVVLASGLFLIFSIGVSSAAVTLAGRCFVD